MFAASLAALMLAGAPTPGAQLSSQDATTSAPADLGAIDVVGSRTSVEKLAQDYVSEVGAPPPGVGLARWNDLVCVGVANLTSPYAQLVVDRISGVATALSLRVGEPGCRANIMVMFAVDATDVAHALVQDDPNAFRPALSRTDLGAEALHQFLNEERPIRWWHVAQEVETDTGTPPLITRIVVSGIETEAPVLNVRQMSHIRSGVRSDLQRAIIIVDVNRVRPANLASVADYVAMVALAQINPDVDVAGQPSILSLFSDQSGADRLTDWDMNYLLSLYGAARDRRSFPQQAREIVDAMVRRRAGGDQH